MNLKEEIVKLKKSNKSNKEIADLLGIPVGTVKSIYHRYEESIAIHDRCCFCGATLKHTPGKKKKKYCNNDCRHKFWKFHRDLLNKKANYLCTCDYCHNSFISYGNGHRKFCSRSCYFKARYGGNSNG